MSKLECEVCKILKIDSHLLNGNRNVIHKNTLYKILKGKTLDIYLCTFHDIELFQLGESNFLKQNIEFSKYIHKKFTPKKDRFDDLL